MPVAEESEFVKEYYRMCQKADEMQGLWERLSRDIVSDGTSISTFQLKRGQAVLENLFWIPTFEQLVNIHENIQYNNQDHDVQIVWHYYDFFKDLDSASIDYLKLFGDLRQLMIAVIYLKKWGKVWTGKEWKSQD
ncbi:MAG: hypothetical protein GY754_12260 [bacterium]|nr:hypothetical protein [bacterium]